MKHLTYRQISTGYNTSASFLEQLLIFVQRLVLAETEHRMEVTIFHSPYFQETFECLAAIRVFDKDGERRFDLTGKEIKFRVELVTAKGESK